jgi:hypothetical protein
MNYNIRLSIDSKELDKRILEAYKEIDKHERISSSSKKER